MQVKHTHEEKTVQMDILKLLSICITVLIMHIISVYQIWVPQIQSEGSYISPTHRNASPPWAAYRGVWKCL